ncbi:MAG: response regulator transcription factor [Rhodospirillaceae bacterium]|jgi:DNA-binding NarL/FixJ family response regulator|nr:response regulator transcription factor [Rhodospirillaceae bacterium]MBT5455705.1 response regulator transcription factor [Rhodospirillaceae bacterium]
MSDAPTPPVSILLVEDDPVARRYFARIINGDDRLNLVDDVGTAEAAIAALGDHNPDLLVTDIGLPDGSGIDIIRALKEMNPKSEALVITVFDDERHVIDAIEAGATGYVLKDSAPEDITATIFELLDGGSPISPSIARYLLRRFSDAPSRPAGDDEARTSEGIEDLTTRELEILELVAKGFNYGEIAGSLDISRHTVTTHVKNLYRKLSVHSRTEAVFEAVQMGLISLK